MTLPGALLESRLDVGRAASADANRFHRCCSRDNGVHVDIRIRVRGQARREPTADSASRPSSRGRGGALTSRVVGSRVQRALASSQLLHLLKEGVRRAAFFAVSVGAGTYCTVPLHLAAQYDDQNARPFRGGLEVLEDLPACHLRHGEIENQYVWWIGPYRVENFKTVCGCPSSYATKLKVVTIGVTRVLHPRSVSRNPDPARSAPFDSGQGLAEAGCSACHRWKKRLEPNSWCIYRNTWARTGLITWEHAHRRQAARSRLPPREPPGMARPPLG
jgi:hypothetical protein